MAIKPLNSKAPQWFKDWHSDHFKPVRDKSVRNERMIYVLLVAVLAMNTVGNYYHKQIMDFFLNFIGG